MVDGRVYSRRRRTRDTKRQTDSWLSTLTRAAIIAAVRYGHAEAYAFHPASIKHWNIALLSIDDTKRLSDRHFLSCMPSYPVQFKSTRIILGVSRKGNHGSFNRNPTGGFVDGESTGQYSPFSSSPGHDSCIVSSITDTVTAGDAILSMDPSSSTNHSQPLHLNYLTDSEDAILSTLMGDFTLAPASQISYFYLHKTIGLSEEVMWKITLERGSILGLTTANLQAKVDLLRSAMELSDEDIRVILQKQPAVLTLSALHLAASIDFLVNELLLNKAQLRSMILLYPSILTYSLQNLQRKISFFIDDVGYSIDNSIELVLRTPQLLTLSVDENLLPRYIFFREQIKMSKEDVQRMMKKNPNTFATYSLQNNIIPKLIGLFTKKLFFEHVHLLKMLQLYPQFLDRSLNHYLIPLTQYFLQDLMFSPLELRTILTQFPRFLSYSLPRVKHVAAYLRYEEGFRADQVKRIFFQAPQIVGLKEEHLKEKIHFVRTALQLRATDDERLKIIIAGMPSLLKCSLEGNLSPKVEYLLEAFHNSVDHLREAILLQPTLLGYSLERRIRPRMELLKKCGLEPKKITIAITLREENFQLWLVSQNMSPNEKAIARQQKKEQSRRSDDTDDELPVHGKKLMDEAGRIILWSRPVLET